MVPEIAIIGIPTDKYPSARPWMMLIAAPNVQDLARSCVGLIYIYINIIMLLKLFPRHVC